MKRIINHKVYDTSKSYAIGGYKVSNTRYTYYRTRQGEPYILQEELDKENRVWTAQIIPANPQIDFSFAFPSC